MADRCEWIAYFVCDTRSKAGKGGEFHMLCPLGGCRRVLDEYQRTGIFIPSKLSEARQYFGGRFTAAEQLGFRFRLFPPSRDSFPKCREQDVDGLTFGICRNL